MKAAPWLRICKQAKQAAFGSYRLIALQGRQLQLRGAGLSSGVASSGTLMKALQGCLPHQIASFGRPLPPSSHAATQQLLRRTGWRQHCSYSEPSHAATGRCVTMAAHTASFAAAATESATKSALTARSSNGSEPAVGWHRRTRVQDIKVRWLPARNTPDSEAISKPRVLAADRSILYL